MNKVIVITGASDGIGAEAARVLRSLGNRVVVVGRDQEKTAEFALEIGAPYYVADFASLSQVKALGQKLLADFPHIDILINNAGAIMSERQETVDGHEQTFQINHLSPFLLTRLLLPRLIADKASIINTSSVANRIYARFDINDLDMHIDYNPQRAYGNTKLANILFTRELHRRFGDQGVSAVAFHPGNVATNFSANSTSYLRLVWQTPLKRFLMTPQKGAETLLWLAKGTPGQDWKPGEYYEKRHIARANKQAYDPLLAQKLWEESETMIARFLV